MNAYTSGSPLYPPLPSQLGFRDYGRFLSNLTKAIRDEATAIGFYRMLMESAQNETQRANIEHAYKDEQQHLKMFTHLYQKLTGKQASIQRDKVTFSNYEAGLEQAFAAELSAAEMYRDMYLSVRLPRIRDMLFRALTDEMEHAQRFNFIYTQVRTR